MDMVGSSPATDDSEGWCDSEHGLQMVVTVAVMERKGMERGPRGGRKIGLGCRWARTPAGIQNTHPNPRLAKNQQWNPGE